MKYIKFLFATIMGVALFTACHTYKEPSPEDNYIKEGSEEEWKATMTIDEFLNSKHFTLLGNEEKYPARPRSHKGDNLNNENLGLFSVEDIESDKDIIIVGRIVSTDAPGNIYKAIYIQDVKKPEYGLKIGVDAGSVGGMFPIGQKIAIKLNGLAIGKYAFMPQIGIPYFNNAKDGLDDAGKSGWEVGRIPAKILYEHVQVIGVPDRSKIVVNPMSISDIKSIISSPFVPEAEYKNVALHTARLVRIDGIHFVPYSWNNNDLKELAGNYDCTGDGEANTFAPTTNGVGYPQSRCFSTDVDSITAANTLAIGTSEYAKFACAPLPGRQYWGSVTGMLSFYYDRGKYNVSPNKVWTLTINGLTDIKLVSNEDGSEWKAEDVYYPAY